MTRSVQVVAGVTPYAAVRVALKMRAADRMELDATNWDPTPQQYAQKAISAPGTKHTILVDGVPAAILGATQITPGVASLWGWGTDEAYLARKVATRLLCRTVGLLLTTDSGVHRVQACSHIARPDAHRWLRTAGLWREAQLRDFGRHGEDFVMFAATRTTYRKARKAEHVDSSAGQ